MRTFIVIAAVVLASASAQARPLRGLSLTSSDEPVISDQSRDQTKTVTAPQPTIVSQADQATQAGFATQPTASPAPQATETPKFVERPPAIAATATTTTTNTPKTDAVKTDMVKTDMVKTNAVKSDAVKLDDSGPNAARATVNEKTKTQRASRRNDLTVARVIHELHRYGIYW